MTAMVISENTILCIFYRGLRYLARHGIVAETGNAHFEDTDGEYKDYKPYDTGSEDDESQDTVMEDAESEDTRSDVMSEDFMIGITGHSNMALRGLWVLYLNLNFASGMLSRLTFFERCLANVNMVWHPCRDSEDPSVVVWTVMVVAPRNIPAFSKPWLYKGGQVTVDEFKEEDDEI